MEYNIESYILTCIKDVVTEVYSAIHKIHQDKEYIFKYHNSEDEVGILRYLEDKVPYIPTIYYNNIGTNISPTGKSYKELIVMSKIKGEVLSNRFDSNPFKLRDQSLDVKKHIITEIIKIISVLHKHNIIYNDTLPGNIIISDSLQPYLIDFGQSLYTNNIPDYYGEIIQRRPITSDIFFLQSLIFEAFPNHVLLDSDTQNLSDLIILIDNMYEYIL